MAVSCALNPFGQTANSVTASLPNSTTGSDVVIASVIASSEGSFTSISEITASTPGWTRLAHSGTVVSGTEGGYYFSAWLLVAGTNTASVSFHDPNLTSLVWVVNMLRFSGVDNVNPVNASNAGINFAEQAVSASLTASSITPTDNGSLLIYLNADMYGKLGDLEMEPAGMGIAQSGRADATVTPAKIACFTASVGAVATGDKTQLITEVVNEPSGSKPGAFMFSLQRNCV